jgi:thiosulfate/3-mercaptopyruvate sulfurtransferase
MAGLPYPLVEAQWLVARLGERGLKLIDGSWRMPGQGDAYTDYLSRHIPGAVFFAIDEIADKATALPHMLPSRGVFEAAVGALGVSEQDRVVVYDDQGASSAARVWWTFKAMGHKQVSVLNGGLAAYMAAAGHSTDLLQTGPGSPAPQTYRASPDRMRLARAGDVRRALSAGEPVIDARPQGRFDGRDAEPRPGLRRGAMPGAQNVPWASLIGADGRLRSSSEIAAALSASGASAARPAITTCGSGVTAAILALAIEALGWPPARLYDGSWAEWGRETNDLAQFPVAPGASD